jgi:hypothetical protein
VLVAAYAVAQHLEAHRRGIFRVTVARLAPPLVGIDLLELAVVDGVNANAVVAALC